MFPIRLSAAALMLALQAVSGADAPAREHALTHTLTFVVGAGAGSVFDNHTRVLSRHIGRHLPGHPEVVVRNMVGGGGVVAAEYLYREARPDGRTVGNWAGDIIHNQIFGGREVRLDTRRFGWVGAVSTLHPVCVLTRASGIDDLAAWAGANRPVRLGGIGRDDATTNMARVLGAVLGLPLKLVYGYRGPVQVRLAAGNQEVEGGCGYWQAVRTAWRKMLAAREAKVVLQAMPEPHPDLPEVPNALDRVQSPDDRMLLMSGVHDPAKIARAYALPPGTAGTRLAALRKAFAATVADPAFVAEANSRGLEVRPVTGASIEETVKGLFALDPKIIVHLRKLLFPEKPAGDP